MCLMSHRKERLAENTHFAVFCESQQIPIISDFDRISSLCEDDQIPSIVFLDLSSVESCSLRREHQN